MEGKREWPELVGLDGEEAVKIIQGENADLNVIMMDNNRPQTRDLRPNRVRVLVDPETKKVSHKPFCG